MYLDEGMELAERAEHIAFLQYLSVGRGIVELAGARWSAAIRGGERGAGVVPSDPLCRSP